MSPLSGIPASWRWASFGEVARVASNLVDPRDFMDWPHVAPNHIESGTGRLLPYRTIAEDGVTSAKHLFRAGQLVYSKIRPYLTKVVDVGFDGLCSADMYPIDCFIDRRFLFHWMLSPAFTAAAAGHQARTVLPKINERALSQLSVPVPPLDEQRRIVAALECQLSSWEAGNSQLTQLQRRISRFRDQVMLLASVGQLRGGESHGTALPPEPAGVQDGELPTIPDSWRWKRLEEIADVVGGVTKDSKRQSDPHFVEVPYLRVANVQRARLDLSKVAHIKVSPEKAEKLRLRAGDVLLNEGGDRDKLGRGWIWEGQLPDCIHQNHVFRARIRDDVLHPKLLAWHANGFGRRWFEVNGLQSVNLASISLGKMKKFPVPVPPRSEQGKLVQVAEEYLSLLDSMERALASARYKAGQLRAALLAEAFAGRLAPQDINDEPASELLARIKTERAAAPPKQRTRSRRTPTDLPAPATTVTGDDYQQEVLPL